MKTKRMKAKEKVSELYWKASGRGRALREQAEGFFTRKTEGASHFVEILVAIIVVVALAFIFKDQITALMTSIISKATTQAESLF